MSPLPDLTLKEKVLLWLVHAEKRADGAPDLGATQPGIAEATGLSRGHVSRTVAPLVAAGHLVEESVRVAGFSRALKAYRVTPEGRSAHERLAAVLHKANVEARDGSGSAVKITMAEALARRGGPPSLWDAVASLEAHGHVRLDGAAPTVPARARFFRGLEDAPPQGLFVGRSQEVQSLQAWLDGPVSLFVLEGPGGMGKTTLAAQAVRAADPRRHILWLRLTEWTTPAELVARLDAMLASLGRPAGRAGDEAPEALRAHLAPRVKGLPLLLVIDDVQKAQEGLRRIVHLLVDLTRQNAPAKALLVGREVGLPPGVARHAATERLHPLSDQEAETLLRERGVPSEGRAALIQAAHGNPLFLELLAQSGDRPGSSTDFARFLHKDLAAGMPPAQRDLMTWGSALRAPVPGRFFETLGVGSPAALAELEQASLIKQRTDGRYEMHDVVREALYAQLGFDERRRIHGRLAEQFRPDRRDPTGASWEGVAEFLHHLVAAGRRDEAVRWVLRNQTQLMARAQALFESGRPAGGNMVGVPT